MNQISLINTVLSWERKLEIEEEIRKNRRVQPERYNDLSEEAQVLQKGNRPFLARIFKPERNNEASHYCCTSENHRGMQFG